MKKEAALSCLAGVVLPMVLTAFFHQAFPASRAAEAAARPASEGLLPDDGEALTVRGSDGEDRVMTLEEYLTGVVLAEMPADFETEALKAQAVVARTYTRKRMEGSKHTGAAVCMDSGCCQGFRSPAEYLAEGGTQRSVERVRAAVEATDGLVLRYGGELIDATYFSCSGGSTEDAVAVWGQDVPYLQAVDSPGEEDAPRFTDSVTFSPAELAGRLGLPDDGDPRDWFGAVTYTEGGGVATMVVRGQTFTGVQLRSGLGLRSTAFQVRATGDSITITTRGFGHRVGMSQYGAQAMAAAGSTFGEILAHYYTGAELVREG